MRALVVWLEPSFPHAQVQVLLADKQALQMQVAAARDDGNALAASKDQAAGKLKEEIVLLREEILRWEGMAFPACLWAG